MELPAILAGPIIRRVDSSCVYIWIALRHKVEIEAQLFKIDIKGNGEKNKYNPLRVHTKTKMFEAGKLLYIYMIKIAPEGSPFPACTLLGYNLFFKKGRLVHDLGSYDLLTPDHPRTIVYGDLKFPSFYISREGEPANLLYGSCRKPHGHGVDALLAADGLIQNKHLDLSIRPSALFLMGDQIYADDVGDPLFPILAKLGKELTGKNGDSKLSSILPESLHSQINQVNGRQFVIEHLANFSTRKGDNHLLTAGEYAAMYLFCWSPEISDYIHENELLLNYQQLREKNMLHLKFEKDDKKRAKELTLLERKYEEQIENIRDFIVSLPATRRLMANIPTYMIFDDHDLTDDWNISEKWTASVKESPLGKQIIGNGLSAYWLFQGWGNEPESFDQAFMQKVKGYLNSSNIESSGYTEGLNFLWEYHSWHFVAPTVPKTLFLDTRTLREFDPRPMPVKLGCVIEETTRTPLLIGKAGWERVTQKLMQSGWREKSPLNIVSPAPFYGMGLIESFLHKHVYPFKVLGLPVQTSFDFDGWKYNGKGFHTFISQVSSWDPSYCILLSGDVHFSFSVKSDVQFTTGQSCSFYQFTSSPIHNESFTGIWGAIMKSVLWFNARKRREESIYRSCNESFKLTLEKNEIKRNEHRLWEELIHYYSFEDGSIAETKNSIGYLKVEEGRLENTLLMTGENSGNVKN